MLFHFILFTGENIIFCCTYLLLFVYLPLSALLFTLYCLFYFLSVLKFSPIFANICLP
jgi:hypothetical protein